VTEVAKGSLADRAGVKPGDEIRAMRGQPILSVADVQFVLQHFPDEGGELDILMHRPVPEDQRPLVGIEMPLKMTLPRLWRQAEDFGWRYRVAGYAMWLWTGVTFADHPKGVRVANLSPQWYKKPNWKARSQFKKNDIIIEADGKKGWTRSTFLAHLMRDKKLASIVKMKVLRRGETIDVQFPIPTKQPEVLGH
jgi:S1-C subfamily serine protease